MSKTKLSEREAFEQLVRETCSTNEHTFKLDGGAYFCTTYAKSHDGMPPREMASVQTLWNFYQAGAAHQRQQAREEVVVVPELAECWKLADQLANGSHLDEAPNHDDDSLRELACRLPYSKRLMAQAERAEKLAALLDRVITEVGRTITSELRDDIDAALAEVKP